MDQDDERGSNHRGRGGMQNNAKLAMIRVGRGGVHVGHLHQRQQGQQNQAQNRYAYGKCSPAPVCAVWLESVQKVVAPCFQNTQNWMLSWQERLHYGPDGPTAYLLDSDSSKM